MEYLINMIYIKPHRTPPRSPHASFVRWLVLWLPAWMLAFKHDGKSVGTWLAEVESQLTRK